MTDIISRHRRHRIESLIGRLYATLDQLEAVPPAERKLPMPEPMRGPAHRLLAEAGRLAPLPREVRVRPALPGDLLATTLAALMAIKSLLERANSRQFANAGTTYLRGEPGGYDDSPFARERDHDE